MNEILEEIWREDAYALAHSHIESGHTPEWARKILQSASSGKDDRILALKAVYREQFPSVNFNDPNECYEGLTRSFGATRRGVSLQARVQNLDNSKLLDADEVRSQLEQKLKFAHKLPKNHVRALLLRECGVMTLLDGKPYTNSDPRAIVIKEKAIHFAKEIAYYFGLQIKETQTEVEIANKLIMRLGLKAKQLCTTGGRRNRIRVWGLSGLWEPTRVKMLTAAITRLGGDVTQVSQHPPCEYLLVVAEAKKRQRKPEQLPIVPSRVLAALRVPLPDDSKSDQVSSLAA